VIEPYADIKNSLVLIKAGAKAPEHNHALRGWRLLVYDVLNWTVRVGIITVIAYIIYKIF